MLIIYNNTLLYPSFKKYIIQEWIIHRIFSEFSFGVVHFDSCLPHIEPYFVIK